MFKEYYIGSYKDFRSDVSPIIHCIGLQGSNLTGLELGTYTGDSLMTILDNCSNIEKMYSIDCYVPYFNEWEQRAVTPMEMEIIRSESLIKQKYNQHGHKITFIEKYSKDAVSEFEDASLDFIFIDAAHDYNSVMEDLKIWYPKVKTGGLISGHDYHMKSVESAVNDFRKTNNITSVMSTYLSCYTWKK